jgi:hypothetical protein
MTEVKPEMRITDEEIEAIKSAFQGNIKLLKIMRKIFLPEYDPKAPLGQTVDLWTIKDISSMPPEEVKIYFLARKDLIMHIESQLMQLQILAGTKLETMEEWTARNKKNSNK